VQVLADYIRQSIVHSLVILLMGEVLLRLWVLRGPAQRVSLRLIVFFLPPVAYLAFLLLSPQRWQISFALNSALLDTRPWLAADTGLAVWATSVFVSAVAFATLTFLLQLLLFASHRRTAPHGQPWRQAQLPALERAVETLMGRLERALPSIYVLDSAQPVLYAISGAKGEIVISSGLVATLDGDELTAALAHELAHDDIIARRLRWLAWLGRALMFYNPVALVVLRLCLHEVEAYCDEKAGMVTGKPLACASALLKVCRQAKPGNAPWHWASLVQALTARAESLQELGEQAAVIERIERLLRGQTGEREADWHWLRLASLAAASLGLLYWLL
jgi:Zn-dependent protease with chaperone function